MDGPEVDHLGPARLLPRPPGRSSERPRDPAASDSGRRPAHSGRGSAAGAEAGAPDAAHGLRARLSDRRPASRDSWLAGRSIIGGLWKAVLEREIPYEISARAQRLIWENGRVAGVEIERADGQAERVMARRGVLLNTGGFDWNEQFSRRYLPGLRRRPAHPPSNTGDGHVMAMSLGAATALMDKAIWIPAIRIPGDRHDEGQPLLRMFNLELARLYSIVVNRTGRRFASEAAYFEVTDAWAHMNPHSREYDNMPSYFICDEQYRQTYGFPGAGPRGSGSRLDHAAPDAVGPRRRARDRSRRAHGRGRHLQRGRRDGHRPALSPRRNGLRAVLGRARSQAQLDHGAGAGRAVLRLPALPDPFRRARWGVVTTPDAEVVHADGWIIPGLYACGNTAANLLFGASYASGSAIGSSMVFGYRAIEHAAS